MTPDRLIEIRKQRFKESRRLFAERTGIAERTLLRYERGKSPIPLVLGFTIAARLYGLLPYGFDELQKDDQ